MNCPICPATALVATERLGVTIDYCPKCRGVWLDRGELDAIVERSGPTRSRVAGGEHDAHRPDDDHRDRRWEHDRHEHDDDDDDRHRDHHDEHRSDRYDEHRGHHHDEGHGGHHGQTRRKSFLRDLFDF